MPPEIARTLPDPLLRLIGYARGAYALGYVDDVRDPLDALRGRASETRLGDLEKAAERIGADAPAAVAALGSARGGPSR